MVSPIIRSKSTRSPRFVIPTRDTMMTRMVCTNKARHNIYIEQATHNWQLGTKEFIGLVTMNTGLWVTFAPLNAS